MDQKNYKAKGPVSWIAKLRFDLHNRWMEPSFSRSVSMVPNVCCRQVTVLFAAVERVTVVGSLQLDDVLLATARSLSGE